MLNINIYCVNKSEYVQEMVKKIKKEQWKSPKSIQSPDAIYGETRRGAFVLHKQGGILHAEALGSNSGDSPLL